jgi:hypothetical protein
MVAENETDPSVELSLTTAYLFGKGKGLSEEDARSFARAEVMRDRFFSEAFRSPHNVSLKLLYFVPFFAFTSLAIIGVILETNWWFYTPALVLAVLWTTFRKRSTFWIPILYWLKPLVREIDVADDDLDPYDWRSYFFLPYPHGRANVKMMVNSCYEEVCIYGKGILIRSMLLPHILFLAGFAILAYFSWR